MLSTRRYDTTSRPCMSFLPAKHATEMLPKCERRFDDLRRRVAMLAWRQAQGAGGARLPGSFTMALPSASFENVTYVSSSSRFLDTRSLRGVRVDRRTVRVREVDAARRARPARRTEVHLLPPQRARRPANEYGREGKCAERRGRIRVPELHSNRQPQRPREHRTSSGLSRHELERTEAPRRLGPRARLNGPQVESLPRSALRRPTAESRGCSCDRGRAVGPARRRAHRQPRFREWPLGHAPDPELHETGSTICMMTHDPRFSDASQRTFQLRDGRLVRQ